MQIEQKVIDKNIGQHLQINDYLSEFEFLFVYMSKGYKYYVQQ